MEASLSSFLVFFFSAVSLLVQAYADSRADLVARSCRHNHALYSTSYSRCYFRLVRDLEEDLEHEKFALGASGEPPQRLYFYAQCNEDLSSEDCRQCFDVIKKVLPSCFPATGGRVYFDGCFIRAENYSFFQETTTSDDLWRCSDSIDERPQFKSTVSKAIQEVIRKAVELGGFALQEEEMLDVSVYAMANCWKTLDRDSCAACLAKAAEVSSSCLPSTEGRALNSGCVLRYSDYKFANEMNDESTKETFVLYASYLLAAIAICSSMVIIGFFVGKIVYKRKNCRRKRDGEDMDYSVLLENLHFKYEILEKATEGFNEGNKLGQGGYGEVFKGTLPDGREIAIKRLFMNGKGRAEVVYNEIDVISRAQHKNLLRFLGCCLTVKNSFLVYEFLANRSLDLILFDPKKKKELDWRKRLAIIVGAAEGLAYLHKDCPVRIIHRDIKASNVLLDAKFKPKIADFGLARFSSCENSIIGTSIEGTLGYMAPEYLTRGRLTEKVDVYSFGVLVLEIVSGEQNNKSLTSESFESVVVRAWKHFQSNKVADMIDKSIEIEETREIMRVVQVGLLCTQEMPASRPTMEKVVQMLTQPESGLSPPSKPPFMDMGMEFSSCLDCDRRPHSLLSDF